MNSFYKKKYKYLTPFHACLLEGLTPLVGGGRERHSWHKMPLGLKKNQLCWIRQRLRLRNKASTFKWKKSVSSLWQARERRGERAEGKGSGVKMMPAENGHGAQGTESLDEARKIYQYSWEL